MNAGLIILRVASESRDAPNERDGAAAAQPTVLCIGALPRNPNFKRYQVLTFKLGPSNSSHPCRPAHAACRPSCHGTGSSRWRLTVSCATLTWSRARLAARLPALSRPTGERRGMRRTGARTFTTKGRGRRRGKGRAWEGLVRIKTGLIAESTPEPPPRNVVCR